MKLQYCIDGKVFSKGDILKIKLKKDCTVKERFVKGRIRIISEKYFELDCSNNYESVVLNYHINYIEEVLSIEKHIKDSFV